MRHDRDPRNRPVPARLAGVRTAWHTVGDGEFFCEVCGGDRNYRRRTGRRRFVLLGLPVCSRGGAGTVVECASCRTRSGTEVLDRPTTTRLATLLRDAVHSISLAVLAAGGAEARAAREAAVEVVRAAGFPDCSEEQFTTLLAALTADGVSVGAGLGRGLAALAPHLAPAGREGLLLQGARIALADGVYRAEERRVLVRIGAALDIGTEDVDRLLAEAARTPS